MLLQFPIKVFSGHASLLHLIVDRRRDLLIGWQELFLLGSLIEDFALNQCIKRLKPPLGQIVRRHLGFLALGLLVNHALDFLKHDLLAVYGGGYGVLGTRIVSGAAGRENQRAERDQD